MTAIDDELQGKSIFITGRLFLDKSTIDPVFNMEAKGHPILERKVEVLQWEEVSNQKRKGKNANTENKNPKIDY